MQSEVIRAIHAEDSLCCAVFQRSKLPVPDKPLATWGDVIPKEKLIYAVGWFNSMAPLQRDKCLNGTSDACQDSKYGGEPSFSIANHLANLNGNGDRKWMNSQGTWVMLAKGGRAILLTPASRCTGECRPNQRGCQLDDDLPARY